jgi:hypothetical protein
MHLMYTIDQAVQLSLPLLAKCLWMEHPGQRFEADPMRGPALLTNSSLNGNILPDWTAAMVLHPPRALTLSTVVP